MFTITKIALAATLVVATSAVAFAEFDPNLANRYPAYAGPGAAQQTYRTFQSAPAQLHQGGAAAVSQDSPFEINRADRASSPHAGGGL